MVQLYDFFRGAAGFSLIVGGFSLLIVSAVPKLHHYFACFFISLGSLFTLSSLDHIMRLPEELGNFLVLGLVYLVSQSLFEIIVFAFGGARQIRRASVVWWVGGLWSAALWLVPFIDYGLAPGAGLVSVEDGHQLGVLHHFSNWLSYAWPLGVTVYSLFITQWNLRDLPPKSKALKPLAIGLFAIAIVLSTTSIALIINSRDLYRLAQSLLEFFLLAAYFFVLRKPQAFLQFREELETRHQQKSYLHDSENQIISERLERLLAEEQIFRDPDLRLNLLARRVQLPAYRLSQYFNNCLHTTFPVWLNELRIDFVRQALQANPELRILTLAQSAGYATKGIFNAQFRKITGMSPSQFRKEIETKTD